MVTFTVFTPTFNRAHTLTRVYESLKAQTFTDFEWLIVDDGSSDGTSNLVKKWIDAPHPKVRYIKQANAGKHVAFNCGVQNAHGKLFLPLDSDDTCIPTALERFIHHWNTIPKEARHQYSGITCLCQDENGKIIGGPLPSNTLDGHSYSVLRKLRRKEEMWGFHTTEALLQFPFPENPGEHFVPEGLIWNRIGRIYLTRFINEPLRHYYHSSDSLSKKMALIRTESPKSTINYYSELLDLNPPLMEKIKCVANIWRFSISSRRRDLIFPALVKHKFLYRVFFVPGVIFAFIFNCKK